MYPFIRLVFQMFKHRKDKIPAFGEIYETRHICWPWDLDFWSELNNGRTLTLYDMGRMPLAQASGMIDAVKRRKWGMTVAGSCPRYRKRIRAFDKILMKTAAVGWDEKFLYIEQSMWNSRGDCASHALLRMATTDRNGIVPPAEVAREMGYEGPQPQLSDWHKAWIAAEAQRPWPPMQDLPTSKQG